MPSSTAKLRGIIPPMTTPFTADGEIDEKAFRAQIRFFVGKGVHGICVGGSTGEGHTLTREEFRRLMTLAAEELGGRLPLMAGLGLCLLAARSHGRVILDGVYNAFQDDEGLRAECEQGRDMGFDGKTLIHPAQLAVANEVFGPSAAEIDLARRQIAAFDAGRAQGKGIAVVDGSIVENLHVATARATLAAAEAIALRGVGGPRPVAMRDCDHNVGALG